MNKDTWVSSQLSFCFSFYDVFSHFFFFCFLRSLVEPARSPQMYSSGICAVSLSVALSLSCIYPLCH